MLTEILTTYRFIKLIALFVFLIALGLYGLLSLAGVEVTGGICGAILGISIILVILISVLYVSLTSSGSQSSSPSPPPTPPPSSYYPPGQGMYFQQGVQPQQYGYYGQPAVKCRYCDGPMNPGSPLCPKCGRMN